MKKPLIVISVALPIALFVIQICLEIILPPSVLETVHSEWGPHETLQALLTGAGLCLALITIFQISKLSHVPFKKGLIAYFALAALCCLYVTGEEISWGQHIFNWDTPEYWSNLNDQGETNLHNASSLFDQKPRLVLLISIAVGGLIFPILGLFNIKPTPAPLNIILPHEALSVCAFFTVFMSLLDKIDEQLDSLALFERASEVQEVFMFLFVLLYLLFLRQKVLTDESN